MYHFGMLLPYLLKLYYPRTACQGLLQKLVTYGLKKLCCIGCRSVQKRGGVAGDEHTSLYLNDEGKSFLPSTLDVSIVL